MKLDMNHLFDILSAVENYPKAEMTQSELLKAINVDMKNGLQMETFYYHMKIIEEMKLLSCPNSQSIANGRDGFGFMFSSPRGQKTITFSPTADYRLTMRGIKFLEDKPKDFSGWKIFGD